MSPSVSFQQRTVILWVTLSGLRHPVLSDHSESCFALLGSSRRHRTHQNPANPSGLLYGIATLVTSSSEPFGLMAYPTSFDAFP
jgi:hypothetical protein